MMSSHHHEHHFDWIFVITTLPFIRDSVRRLLAITRQAPALGQILPIFVAATGCEGRRSKQPPCALIDLDVA